MDSYTHSYSEALEWSDTMTVRDESNNIILHRRGLKSRRVLLPVWTGREWVVFIDTETWMVLSKANHHYSTSATWCRAKAEKLQTCLDAWLLYMKGWRKWARRFGRYGLGIPLMFKGVVFNLRSVMDTGDKKYSMTVNGVEVVSEIIEHLKTFMSKPLDPIKRSEIPTVEEIRLKLKEKLERDNEAVDKLVKHYTLKITEVMRKQEPTDDLTYFLHCDRLNTAVLGRLADNLLCYGWVLQYEENPVPSCRPIRKMTLRWKPMNEEK